MNAIVPAAPTLGYSDLERLAASIAQSGLFGIKTKDQAIALMMIAQAEGRHPALAARDYDVIQGKPAKKAEAMLRDFLQAGGTVEWHALSDDVADATFTHPQTGKVRIDWNMARATTAGLGGKDMWRKFPRQMLRSRVISEGVRTLWPLATSGLYVPEEVADMKPANDTEHNGPTLDHEPEAPPQRAAAAPMPRAPRVSEPAPKNGKRASIAPPRGAPDSDWRKCLDYIGPALARLRSREQVEEVGDGPTCGDIMEFGPDWAKAELALLLADNFGRFRVENDPQHDPETGELPEVEIVGERYVGAG